MVSAPAACPRCGSAEIHPRRTRGDWSCDDCEHKWQPAGAVEGGARQAARLFLSYGRRDTQELANHLRADLEAQGYQVWLDTQRLQAGADWQQGIMDGLRSTQLVVALLSPHAVRTAGDRQSLDSLDSVCLDEISFARFAQPPTPIVPVMAVPCEPPFCIFRLDYVDLCAWRDSQDQYRAGVQRLLEAIQAALRGEVRYRSWVHQLKPWDFAAFLNEKRQTFCGRQWLFDLLDSWRVASQERALLITGDPGTGKSAIVAELVHRNPGGQVLAYHCCQADTPATLQPGLFVRSLAAMIASKLETYEAVLADPRVEEALSDDSCARDPGSAMEVGILTPLESLPAPPDGVRYILIDALDEALVLDAGHSRTTTIVDVLASRLERLPAWLRIVATTRKEPAVLDRLRGLRAEELSAQDPRNLEDADQYVVSCLQIPELAERLGASGRSTEYVRRLLRAKSAGNFLYIKQALQGIQRDLYRFDQLDALPPGLYGLYLGFFNRHFPDEASYEPVRSVLEVVVAAAEPLTAAQLARASGLDPEAVLPRVLRRLSSYLPERDGRYAVYHKSFADWLTDPAMRGHLHYASRKRGHERLAELCWAEYRQGAGALSDLALRHLPTHLSGAERWEDMAAVLSDAQFVETRSVAGLTYELVTDALTALAYFRDTGDAARMMAIASALYRGTGDIPFANDESFLIWLGTVLASDDDRAQINRTISYVERQPRSPEQLRMVAELLIGLGDHAAAAQFRERHRNDLEETAIDTAETDGLDLLAAEALGDIAGAFALAERADSLPPRRLCRLLKLVNRQLRHPRAPGLMDALLRRAAPFPHALAAVGAATGVLAPSAEARRVQEQAVTALCDPRGAGRTETAEALQLAVYLADRPELLFPLLDGLVQGQSEPETVRRALLYLGWFNPSLQSHHLIARVIATRTPGPQPPAGFRSWRGRVLQAHLSRLNLVHGAANLLHPGHEALLVPVYALWARLLGDLPEGADLQLARLEDLACLTPSYEAVYERDEQSHAPWVALGLALSAAGNMEVSRWFLKRFGALAGSGGKAAAAAFWADSWASVNTWMSASLLTSGVTMVISLLRGILLLLANEAAGFLLLSVYAARRAQRPAPPALIRLLERRKQAGKSIPWWLKWGNRRAWQIAAITLLDANREDLLLELVMARAPARLFHDWQPDLWTGRGHVAALSGVFDRALQAKADPDHKDWSALLTQLTALREAGLPGFLPAAGLRLVSRGRLQLARLIEMTRKFMDGQAVTASMEREMAQLVACLESIPGDDDFVAACYALQEIELPYPNHLACSLLQACLARPSDTFAEVLRAITTWPGMGSETIQAQMRQQYIAIVRDRYVWPLWSRNPWAFRLFRALYRIILAFPPQERMMIRLRAGDRTRSAEFLNRVQRSIVKKLARL